MARVPGTRGNATPCLSAKASMPSRKIFEWGPDSIRAEPPAGIESELIREERGRQLTGGPTEEHVAEESAERYRSRSPRREKSPALSSGGKEHWQEPEEKLEDAWQRIPESVALHLDQQGILNPKDIVDTASTTITKLPGPNGNEENVLVPAEANFVQGIALQVPGLMQGSHDWKAITHL